MAKSEQNVSRWDPFRELEALAGWPPFRGFPLASRLSRDVFGEPNGSLLPHCAIDVTEAADSYVVTAELPGVKKEDVIVECHEGTLSIRGEKRTERDEKKEKGRLLERVYGAFTRSFRLPADANAEEVKASFQDGVLRIAIQKRPEAKPRAIAIK